MENFRLAETVILIIITNTTFYNLYFNARKKTAHEIRKQQPPQKQMELCKLRGLCRLCLEKSLN